MGKESYLTVEQIVEESIKKNSVQRQVNHVVVRTNPDLPQEWVENLMKQIPAYKAAE